MKIVLYVLSLSLVSSLGAVLGQSGSSLGSGCLNTCYTQQGRAYCCSSGNSYHRPLASRPLASGISSFQQPFTSGAYRQPPRTLSTGTYQEPQHTGLTTGSYRPPSTITTGAYQQQALSTGTYNEPQNTGLIAGSYRQPADAYHQHQQVLSTGGYNEPTVINSGSGLQATSDVSYQQSSLSPGSLQDSNVVTIGSRLPSTTSNSESLQQTNVAETSSQSSLLTTGSVEGPQLTSTINAGFAGQPAATIGTTLSGNAIQPPRRTNPGSYQQPATITGDLSTLVNEDAYGQSLAEGIGAYQQSNIQTTDSFSRRPLGSALGSYQQQSHLLSSPIPEDNYHQTTSLGGGTYQRQNSYRQPLTSQRNYNQQLTTGTLSYQRPVSNVRGSYGYQQRPLALSAGGGAYQRS